VLEITELTITVARMETDLKVQPVGGIKLVRFSLLRLQQKVVTDRLVVSDEGVRQLAVTV